MNDRGPQNAADWFEKHRNKTALERLRRVDELNRMARAFHAAAVRLRDPSATDRDVRREWLRFAWGDQLLNEVIAAGHDIYRGLPDEPIIVEEGRADEPT